MELAKAMFIASEAGLYISRTMYKKEDGKPRWAFRIADVPHEAVWREQPDLALAELLRRIFMDRADLLAKHIKEAREAHHDSYADSLQDRLSTTNRLCDSVRTI